MAAFSVSIPLHLALALWLSTQVRQEGPAAEPAVLGEIGTVEAPEPGPEIAPAPTTQEAVRPIAMPAEPSVTADPSWQRMVASPTSTPIEGLAGDSEPPPMVASGGGGAGAVMPSAGTSFFGVRAKGLRFAFVVDKSASMNHDGRMRRAVEELVRSAEGLPDYALFRVCLFDTRVASFPERGYRKARQADLGQFRAWLTSVAAAGGTTPRVAFDRLLEDGAAPDAIFFMTDGEIGGDDPAWIIKRVRMQGRAIPVHCVALGDASAVPQLERIAAATGGKFRFIPGGGMP